MANVFYPLNQLQLMSCGCLQCCLKKASVMHPGSAGKRAGLDYQCLSRFLEGQVALYLPCSAFDLSLTFLCKVISVLTGD